MTIQAIILDLSGTLLDNSNQAVPGVSDMISRFRKRNIDIFVASNNSFDTSKLKRLLNIDDNRFLYPKKIGGRIKGYGDFVRHVCSQLGIPLNKLLYLGDSKNDFMESINSNVLFFLASWSNPTYQYGIPVKTPGTFFDIVETFFLKNELWYYSIDDKDGIGRDVVVRALVNPDITKNTGIMNLLKNKGEFTSVKKIKSFQIDEYLSLHLLASIYLEGLYLSVSNEKPIWCLYPGHEGAYGYLLNSFTMMGSRLFREQYKQDLILRHTEAPSNWKTRHDGGTPIIDTQFQTIQLNPQSKNKIKDHPVIVIDDFTTEAYGFETARNFLLNAQVSSVICIAVGKYPKHYYAFYPKTGLNWNSFAPTSLTDNNFDSIRIPARYNDSALNDFLNDFQ